MAKLLIILGFLWLSLAAITWVLVFDSWEEDPRISPDQDKEEEELDEDDKYR